MANTPAYNKYIGARYVPIVDGLWDNTKKYEPLTIVTYQGASYTSKTYVPVGIPITDGNYWALTGDYNAQVEQIQQDINGIRSDVDDLNSQYGAVVSDLSNVKSDVDNLKPRVDTLDTWKPTVDSNITTLTAGLNTVNNNLATTNNTMLRKSWTRKFIFIGDSYSQNMGDSFPGWYRQAYLDSFQVTNYCYPTTNAIAGSFGGGFAAVGSNGLRFIDVLRNAAENIPWPKEDTTDIIVLGGYNDAAQDLIANVPTAIVQFVDEMLRLFPLPAGRTIKLHIGCPSFSANPVIQRNIWDFCRVVYDRIRTMSRVVWIPNMEYMCHRYDQMIDEAHPTVESATQFTQALSSYISGGGIGKAYSEGSKSASNTVTVTMSPSGINNSTASYVLACFEDDFYIHCKTPPNDAIVINVTPGQYTGYQELFTLSAAKLVKGIVGGVYDYNCTWRQNIMFVKTDNSYVQLECLMMLDGLKVKFICPNPSLTGIVLDIKQMIMSPLDMVLHKSVC